MNQPLAWMIDIKEAANGERTFSRAATAAECGEIAKALDLVSCDGLEAEYTLRPLSMGRYRLKGSLKANVVQACVVSLEPVAAHIEEDFNCEYRPHDMIEEADSATERAVLEAIDIEPLDRNNVDAGRIVFEHLSAALDPYPRKPGAEFEPVEIVVEGEDGAAPPTHPFAVLAKLKSKPEGGGT